MKKLFAGITLLLVLFGCKKSSSTPEQPFFQFKANGTLYQSTTNTAPNDLSIEKDVVFAQPVYFFTFNSLSDESGLEPNNVFSMEIDVDSLTTTIYAGTLYENSGTTGNAFIDLVQIPETNCSWSTSIKQLSVTITRYSNGTIDGTFSGSDTRTGGTCSDETISYTDGVFKNIGVIY